MRTIIAAAAAALVVASPAGAADWRFVARMQAGGEVLVDFTSFGHSGSLKSAWVRYDYQAPAPSGANLTKELEVVDCEARMGAPMVAIEYRLDGSVLHEFSTPPALISSQLSPIAPDTIGEALLNVICAH